MFPSSSAQAVDAALFKSRPRNSSAVEPRLTISTTRQSSRPSSPYLQSPSKDVPIKSHPHYTVLVRLPFRRENFKDPPPVEWNVTKDRQLWKLISGSLAGNGDLDWERLSHEFGVDLSFLLMQAAWLSERHMERMRKQVGRIAGGQADAAATPTASTFGAIKAEKPGSRDLKPSGIPPATGRGSPSLAPSGVLTELPGSSTPQARVALSRTPSSATVTQSKVTGASPRQPLQHAMRGSSGSGRRPAALSNSAANPIRDEYYENAIEHEGRSGSGSEDEPPSALARSSIFRRPPVAKKPKQSLATLGSEGDEEADDDDDSSGGYLPFAAASKADASDQAATLRSSPKRQTVTDPVDPSSVSNRPKTSREDSSATATTESSASSASSAKQRRASSDTASGNDQRPPGPLSPRHRAQLASVSPRARKDGSEGTPSMGSSFSDLDDASVTQSALEEALLSNMRQGGNGYGSTTVGSMASRVSSLRDALGRRVQ